MYGVDLYEISHAYLQWFINYLSLSPQKVKKISHVGRFDFTYYRKKLLQQTWHVFLRSVTVYYFRILNEVTLVSHFASSQICHVVILTVGG
jgi:hypothetical protein